MPNIPYTPQISPSPHEFGRDIRTVIIDGLMQSGAPFAKELTVLRSFCDTVDLTLTYHVVLQFDENTNTSTPVTYQINGTGVVTEIASVPATAIDCSGDKLKVYHIDTDVSGQTGSIPSGIQSWSITVKNQNGPAPTITMSNGTLNIDPLIQTISGSTEQDDSYFDHPIAYNANGNSLYIVYIKKG